MLSKRILALAVLTVLAVLLPSTTAQAGIGISLGIGVPFHHGPFCGPRFYPCFRPAVGVYLAPAPVYVTPAPAAVYVQPVPVYQVPATQLVPVPQPCQPVQTPPPPQAAPGPRPVPVP
jgi:hypothetical protein